MNPIGERSCYDEGKRAAECLTMDYHREHGQEVGAIRSGLCTALASCDCMFLHVSKRVPAAVWPHLNSTAAPRSASLPPQVRIVRIFQHLIYITSLRISAVSCDIFSSCPPGPHRAHLQHVRPAHGAGRRPRRLQLCVAGAAAACTAAVCIAAVAALVCLRCHVQPADECNTCT